GLVDGHRITGSENTDILHTGILRHGAAVAVHGKIFHHVDKSDLAPEMFRHTHGRVRHGLRELIDAGMLIPGLKTVVCLSSRVNQRLSCPAGTADGQLLERSAVSSHGMTFE